MRATIKRKLSFRGLSYSMDGSNLRGKASHTLSILPQKIRVENPQGCIVEMRQANPVLNMLHLLPILNLFVVVPYNIYCNTKKVGWSKRILERPMPAAYQFRVKENQYELRPHNKNEFSLVADGIQAAIFEKELVSVGEVNIYHISFRSDISAEILMLFCIFIDVTYFPGRASISLWRREAFTDFPDKYEERAKWTPHSQLGDNKD